MVKRKSLNKKVKNQVLKYLSSVEKKGIKLDKAIVFGSWAKGNPKEWNDIDLCLVSKKFTGDTFNQSVELASLAHKLGYFIEPHLYTTAELKEKFDPLAEEIRKHGIEVKKELKKVPKKLQPFLWSVDIKNLEIEKDRVYIINQILAFGGLEEIRWLFKVYSKRAIKETFTKKPLKVYIPSSFNFAKEILLGIKNKDLDPYSYDRNLPRRIRR